MSLFDRSAGITLAALIEARRRIDWEGARSSLLEWYRQTGRSLPWRKDLTPYRVWVSEIMLQQTTVATVLGYFDRFMTRFPDVGSLAAAPVERVLKSWEGLGYYQRARNLHNAARVIVDRGGFPADLEAWMELPGVGRSTAGAICSIAFALKTPILDANVRRVQRRFLHAMDPGSSDEGLLWESSTRFVLGAGDPGPVNQALMEVGATICLPRSPRCADCPFSLYCLTATLGLPDALPARKKASRPLRIRTALVPPGRKSVWLLKNEGGRLMEGLWDFLSRPGPPDSLPEGPGWSGRHLGTVEHVYSHFREEVHIFEIEPGSPGGCSEDASRASTVSLDDSAGYPLTGVARKILSFLSDLARGENR
jgi:A/G-specific adenine glycosylase